MITPRVRGIGRGVGRRVEKVIGDGVRKEIQRGD